MLVEALSMSLEPYKLVRKKFTNLIKHKYIVEQFGSDKKIYFCLLKPILLIFPFKFVFDNTSYLFTMKKYNFPMYLFLPNFRYLRCYV